MITVLLLHLDIMGCAASSVQPPRIDQLPQQQPPPYPQPPRHHEPNDFAVARALQEEEDAMLARSLELAKSLQEAEEDAAFAQSLTQSLPSGLHATQGRGRYEGDHLPEFLKDEERGLLDDHADALDEFGEQRAGLRRSEGFSTCTHCDQGAQGPR